MDVIIVGAGIGGLTLALSLQRAGIACRVYEAAPEVKALGLGVSLLPHCVKALDDLGLQAELARVAVATQETAFFNRFGQPVYRESTGRHGGYKWPQFQIHRGDLQSVLLDAFRERVGADRLFTGWKCTGFNDSRPELTAFFCDPVTGTEHPPQRGTLLIACDGIHSVVRKQLHPDEGEPVYSGVNMWRGVARWAPYLTGAS